MHCLTLHFLYISNCPLSWLMTVQFDVDSLLWSSCLLCPKCAPHCPQKNVSLPSGVGKLLSVYLWFSLSTAGLFVFWQVAISQAFALQITSYFAGVWVLDLLDAEPQSMLLSYDKQSTVTAIYHSIYCLYLTNCLLSQLYLLLWMQHHCLCCLYLTNCSLTWLVATLLDVSQQSTVCCLYLTNCPLHS